jgi:hypothetical protein
VSEVSCPNDDVLVALVERGLPAAELVALEAHVDGCAACRQTVAALASGGGSALAATEAPPSRPSVPGVPTLAQGAVVGERYLVGEVLGAGAMGTVYRARDTSLGRDVALKVHRSSADPARTQREAVAMAQLAHPNVVGVFEVGQAAGRAFVAMEYVRGTTLGGWLRAAPRAWHEVIAMMIAAGEGLAAAHRVGLVHRDFKPANVLVGEDGRPRVSDFGLVGGSLDAATSGGLMAAGPGDGPGDDLTVTGALLGTPAYMAPEQLAGGAVDARSDQFAFCVAAWEAVVGERPFVGDSLVTLHEATTAHALRPGWRGPRRLRRVLARGLAPDPAVRYPDMAALLAALRRIARPRRGRIAATLAVGAVALGVATLLGIPYARRVRHAAGCDAAAAEVEALLDGAAATRVRAGIAARGGPDAARLAARTADVLRRHATGLAAATRAACRAAPTAEFAEARAACLADRRRELTATVAELASDGARPGGADGARALDAAWALVEVAPCADVRTLAPPSTATVAERATLDHARRAREPALAKAALPQLAAVRAAASARGDQATVLEAKMLEVDLALAAEDPRAALAAGRAAEAAAEALGRDVAVGTALVRIAEIEGYYLHDHDAAARSAELAHAKLARVGVDNGALVIALLTVEGQVATDRGQPAEGEVRLRAALALALTTYGADHPMSGKIAGTLARTVLALGRGPDAVPIARQAVAAFEAAYGPGAASTAGARTTLGEALGTAGEVDLARTELARADRVFVALGDRGGRITVGQTLGGIELRASRWREARDAYQVALDASIAVSGADAPETAGLHGDLSAAYLGAGDAAHALAEGQTGQAILERALGPDNPWLSINLLDVARAELALGRAADAAGAAERAVALATAGGTGNIGEARLVLAEALWATPATRGRARELATVAAAAHAEGADAWLTAHPAP